MTFYCYTKSRPPNLSLIENQSIYTSKPSIAVTINIKACKSEICLAHLDILIKIRTHYQDASPWYDGVPLLHDFQIPLTSLSLVSN